MDKAEMHRKRQKRYRDRLRSEGKVKVEVWVKQEDKQALLDFVKSLPT